MEGHADIRPGKPEEVRIHRALLRDQERHERIERILEKWGFDNRGTPLTSSMDDYEQQRLALEAWEEIKRTFEASGLLKGSLFDYERELQANYDAPRVPQLGRSVHADPENKPGGP